MTDEASKVAYDSVKTMLSEHSESNGGPTVTPPKPIRGLGRGSRVWLGTGFWLAARVGAVPSIKTMSFNDTVSDRRLRKTLEIEHGQKGLSAIQCVSKFM